MAEGDKITFAEASRLAQIHVNSLRTWAKQGKLKTAEKIIENNREVWIVSAQEVLEVVSQTRGHQSRSANYTGTTTESPAQPAPAMPPGVAIIPAEAYSSLLDLVKSQGERLETLAMEVGSLREKVRQLESREASLNQRQQPSTPPGSPVITPPPPEAVSGLRAAPASNLEQRPAETKEKKPRRWPWSK